MTQTTTTSGSEIVQALEAAWHAVQQEITDLPDVVMITGSGAAGGEWGHTWPDHWIEGNIPVEGGGTQENPITRRTEVFISGERLACGARLTFQTLLHEAVHVLAKQRDIQDTSRQNRYHNKRFVKLASELGLELPAGAEPHPTIGFSGVELLDTTVEKYRTAVDDLEAAIRLHLDLPTGAGLSLTIPKKPRRTATSTNLLVATCECEPARKIRVAPGTLALAAITCAACGENFAVEV